jgi:predicted Zn-dependent protease
LSKNNASTEPSGESRDRLLEYYDHRISAEPTVRANYTVKITYLLSQHKTSDALGACKVAAQVFPGWWRPQMALVVLADPDAQKQAEPQFRKWVEAHPAFIHWWYLSRYYRDLGRDNDAAAALRNAIKYPLEMVDQDETWVPQAFAFDAASYAYRQKRYKLVLNIARVWSSPRGIYNYFDDDIYAFRAAAELALGQFADAKTDADKVVAAASKNAIWAEHLSELQQAANAKNQAFVYEPGDPCGDWTLFPMP